MTEKSYRIYGLFVENFMGLKLAEVKFDGSSVTAIVGDNGAGKTSFLNAIACALGGDKLSPEVPIRNGEDRAEVTADLGEFIVTRKWHRKEDGKTSTSITVKSPDGMKYGSPQDLLNKLIGKLTFDPLEFTRQDPKKQIETLKELAGLDFTILDARRKTYFDQRTAVNTEVRGLRANAEKMHFVEAPDEPVSVAQLLEEQKAVIEEQRRYDGLKHATENATRDRERADQRIVRARDALALAQKELQAAETAGATAKEHEEEAAGEFAVAVKPGLDAIREKLANAEKTNELVRQKKARAEASAKLREKELEAEALTKKIGEIDQNKKNALAAAHFPVPGLSFMSLELPNGEVESYVTLDGVLFEQASQAHKIRVSMAVGLALNPRLKLILIRDGSLIGEKQMQVVSEMADAAGAQVLIERVWRPGEVGVHIEDGLVVNEKAA